MRNVPHPDSWRRLAFALALAAAVFAALIVLVSPGEAIPAPVYCGWNQSELITYYSSITYQNATCTDISKACPGYSPTHICDKTPFYRTTCNSCPLE